jgi:hypothetical protein
VFGVGFASLFSTFTHFPQLSTYFSRRNLQTQQMLFQKSYPKQAYHHSIFLIVVLPLRKNLPFELHARMQEN